MSKKVVKKNVTYEDVAKELFFDDDSNLKVNRLIVFIAVVVGAFAIMVNKASNTGVSKDER